MGLFDTGMQQGQSMPQASGGGLFGGGGMQAPQQPAQGGSGMQLAQSLIADPSQQNAQKVAQAIASKGTAEAKWLADQLMSASSNQDAVKAFGEAVMKHMQGAA